MIRELSDLLAAYLSGWKSIVDCAEWIAGVDWEDPDFDSESQGRVGRLELLATEVLEGLRTEQEFRQEATDLVFEVTGSLYTVQDFVTETRVATSSNDSVVGTPEVIVIDAAGFTEFPAPGSQAWNISPLPAPA